MPSTARSNSEPRVALCCWGVRGSIPTPGMGTSRYGGNTSCVEIRVDDQSLIFDAGTGIRLLGTEMVRRASSGRARIFLTHFHWDHIQGIPFFAPLYSPRYSLDIVGPRQDDLDIRTLFAGQLGPVYFPIPFDTLAADFSFSHLNEGEWDGENGVTVQAMRMRHPSFTVGYRIEVGGKTICYLPDNEIGGGNYPVDGPEWRRRLGEFIGGADLLLHDAMYTEDEYAARKGWGHSTFEQVVDLATKHGVKALHFFHHAPERTDDELDHILRGFQERAATRGGPKVDAAREGVEIVLNEGEEG